MKRTREPSLHTAPIWAIGLFACLLVIVGAVAVGSEPIPPGTTVRILLNRMHLAGAGTWSPQYSAIILRVRLPRVLTGAIVGAALALAGVLMQGLFRNPLASPGILGVSAGGAVGAVLCIAAGIAARNLWALPLASFAGALATIGIVYALATYHGETPVATLLLAGIAMTALAGALTSLVLVISAQRSWDVAREILFWTMGGLDARRREHVALAGIPLIFAAGATTFLVRDLNIMLLGEEQARTLGVDTGRLKVATLAVASVATGAAVAVSGLIGFVGLIVPHAARLLVGPDHRRLVPASLFGGAVFLVTMDTIARTAAPAELRLGILTGALGAPFFLFLLVRYRRRTLHL